MVSRTYPTYHPRKKQPTYFIEKIQLSLDLLVEMPGDLLIDLDPKIHTFRDNFQLWKNRIDEVLAGNAVIVLKYHTLGRYVKGNKQIEFARLDKYSGVGIEEVKFEWNNITYPVLTKDYLTNITITQIAENDGLQVHDFMNWFEKGDYNLKETFACIHFTSFRYGEQGKK